MSQADRAPSTKPSRRRFFLAAPAALATAVAPVAHAADAALLRFGGEIDALAAQAEAVAAEHSRIEEELFLRVGPAPRDGAPRTAEAFDAWVEDNRARSAKMEEVGREIGLHVAEDEMNRVDDRLLKLVRAAGAVRATTLPGLIFKARLCEHEPEIAERIVEDLLALA